MSRNRYNRRSRGTERARETESTPHLTSMEQIKVQIAAQEVHALLTFCAAEGDSWARCYLRANAVESLTNVGIHFLEFLERHADGANWNYPTENLEIG